MRLNGFILRLYFIYSLGFFLLLASAIYIVGLSSQAAANTQTGVVLLLPAVNVGANVFCIAEVNDWGLNRQAEVEAARVSAQVIQSQLNSVFSRVVVTGSDYFNIMHMPFLYGSPWRDDSSNSVVVCRSIAWALFGSLHVAGLEVDIGGESFTIVGVVEDRAAFTNGFLGGFVWMPRASTNEMAGVIYIRPENRNIITGFSYAEDLLSHLGLFRGSALITNIDSYLRGMAQRGHLHLAIAGAILLAMFYKNLYAAVKLGGWGRGYIVMAAFGLSGLFALVLFVSNLSIELWQPAFVEGGLLGYGQSLFSSRFHAHENFLPASLLAISQASTRVNMAFGVGLLGVLLMITAWFLSCANYEVIKHS